MQKLKQHGRYSSLNAARSQTAQEELVWVVVLTRLANVFCQRPLLDLLSSRMLAIFQLGSSKERQRQSTRCTAPGPWDEKTTASSLVTAERRHLPEEPSGVWSAPDKKQFSLMWQVWLEREVKTNFSFNRDWQFVKVRLAMSATVFARTLRMTLVSG